HDDLVPVPGGRTEPARSHLTGIRVRTPKFCFRGESRSTRPWKCGFKNAQVNASFPGTGDGNGTRCFGQWQQAYLTVTEKGKRIQIGGPAQKTPMQAGLLGAVLRFGRKSAERLV